MDLRAREARPRYGRAEPEAYLDDEHEPRILLQNISWRQYDELIASVGERPSLRMTYLDGDLELMTLSTIHETIKKMIARLVEAYGEEMDLPLNGIGSATFRNRARKAGLEPDECYVLGKFHRYPDLAIEVVHSRGAIDKLDVYRRLGIREVWIYEKGTITAHVLRASGYRISPRSVLFPKLDLDALVRHLDVEDQTRAVKRYRAWLRRVTG